MKTPKPSDLPSSIFGFQSKASYFGSLLANTLFLNLSFLCHLVGAFFLFGGSNWLLNPFAVHLHYTRWPSQEKVCSEPFVCCVKRVQGFAGFRPTFNLLFIKRARQGPGAATEGEGHVRGSEVLPAEGPVAIARFHGHHWESVRSGGQQPAEKDDGYISSPKKKRL